jgi:pimeloyl-ACP methyl ester carboxylesterase
VITNAATGSTNVKALVYIAAFAPDEDESIGIFSDPNKYPGSKITPDTLITTQYPGGMETIIDPVRFPGIFAADLPKAASGKMAVRQRPASAAAFDNFGQPAWKAIPSWYLVANQDRAISPVAERYMAQRAHTHTVEINASHAVYISQPQATAQLIESAARHTG